MSAMTIDTALENISKSGYLLEAELIRQHIAQLQLAAIRSGVDGGLQRVVARNVKARGYDRRKDGTPWTPDELAARQTLKAISEGCEALACVRWRETGNVRVMREAAASAQEMVDFIFQLEADCAGATIGDRAHFLKECADTAIPVLVAFEAQGASLSDHALRKSEDDIERGVK